MLKRLYEKSRLGFAIAWIVAYCVLLSVGDALSASLGVEKAVTLPIALLLSALLLLFLVRHRLSGAYGLCRPRARARAMLYYLPLLLLLSTNLWYGVQPQYGLAETVLYILSMLCVGFLEEVIFRGLLFNVMRRENPTAAVAVSSITFGIGHILNLVNGSGAELLQSLLQVVYATAAGFLFVMIYVRSESLLVCIFTHGVFNALSAFSNEAAAGDGMRILFCLLLTLISLAYALCLALPLRRKRTENTEKAEKTEKTEKKPNGPQDG